MIKRTIHAITGLFGYRLTPVQVDTIGSPPFHVFFSNYKIIVPSRELVEAYTRYPLYNAVIRRCVETISDEAPVFTAIDIGANCGDSLALMKCGGNPEILCIEGDQSQVSLLAANSKQFDGVSIVSKYLSDRTEEKTVAVNKLGYNSTLSDSGFLQTLELSTLDDILVSIPLNSPVKFIKIDTEGYDVRILFGSISTIKKANPIILFEYNRDAMRLNDEDGFRIFNFLRNLGYGFLLFFDAYGKFIVSVSVDQESIIRNLHDYADGTLGTVYYYDIVCVHAEHRDFVSRFFARGPFENGFRR